MSKEDAYSFHIEKAIDRIAGACSVLTRDDITQFIFNGYVLVKGAFSRELAVAITDQAWKELEEVHGVDRGDSRTWNKHFLGPDGVRGYVRTTGSKARFNLKEVAPRAFQAQVDVVGGVDKLMAGDALAWSNNAIGNLGGFGTTEWETPSPKQRGWHKDGWHFRHFLNSPEQGLLTVPILTDILPQSGGTFMAVDSVNPVARFLSEHPEGLHPDSVQGAGYLIPGLIEQCERYEELTGEAGDVAILHPFMLHRVCANPSTRPRFIQNVAVQLKQPMQFARSDENYSLVELATLNTLESARFEYRQTNPMLASVPFPVRDDETKKKEKVVLQSEMRTMAANGVVTPSWGVDQGYESNQSYA